MNKQFTLPSGMVVELRARTISEMKETLRAMQHGTTKAATSALDAATVGLIDKGPYPESIMANDGRVDWNQALAGDRLAALIFMRVAAYGEKGNVYQTRLQCSVCPKQFDWEVDLRPEPEGDLLLYEMSEETKERFQKGLPSECMIQGKRVVFRQLMAKDELSLEGLSEKGDDFDTEMLGMLLRIIEVEGVDPNDIRKWIDGLGIDRQELMLAMAEDDVSVETTIDVYCPKCKSHQEAMLPFGADFWVPQDAARNRRRRHLEKVRMSKRSRG